MDDAQAYYLYMTLDTEMKVMCPIVGGRKGNIEALECKLEWNYL
jgi:hypothetical protein